MKLGKFEFDAPIFLAPMAGVTDIAYRIIAHEFDCPLIFSEMVSSLGIHYRNEKTLQMLETVDEERPIAIQIFGSDPERMSEAAEYIESLNVADVIDVNFGCPVQKVVKNHEGSALLKDPELAEKILRAIRRKIKLPLTVKMRIGWDSDNSVELAKRFESTGVDAITIHGRTREQFYSGRADWNSIANAKKAVKIPVIANGDISSVETLEQIREVTRADGFMIGRAAEGNPWIFRELVEFYRTGRRVESPNIFERVRVMKRHLDLLIKYKGEKVGLLEMRRHASWYTKGMINSSALRGRFNQANSREEFFSIFDNLKNFC